MNQTNTHNNNIIYADSKMPREVISCWEIHGACPHKNILLQFAKYFLFLVETILL